MVDRLNELMTEFEFLRSDAGMLQFLTEKIGLPQETVGRIHRLGAPWPGWYLPYPEWLQEYDDLDDGLIALTPVIDMDIEDARAQIKRGEMPAGAEKFNTHWDKMMDLTGEERDTVIKVNEALLDYLERLNELVAEYAKEAEKQKTRAQGSETKDQGSGYADGWQDAGERRA